MDVAAWLKNLGLGKYERTFREHDVDADVVSELGDADLEKLGVSLGHRKRLLKAIAGLREGSAGSVNVATRREPERRQLTVMFVDLVGSTALSQSLDPEDMRDVLGAYQGIAIRAIEQYDGYVAKLLGDGILVYFGWPAAHEDDPERAVLAGLAIVDAVSAQPVAEAGSLAVRVGIATGLSLVGTFAGEGYSQDEVVVGETPNLAARLQTLAAPNSIVIAASTRRLTSGRFALADLGSHDLKGFAARVPAWQVVGLSDIGGRFAARTAAGLTPLVGREAELTVLLDRWRQAKGGHGQAVLVSGEPGIGKSRLAQALRERLRGEAVGWLLYQCSPHHLQSALWPVIDCLERTAGFRRDDTLNARLAKFETLLAPAPAGDPAAVALLAALLGLPLQGGHVALDLSPKEQRSETLGVLVRHIKSMAESGPVLAVLEDAHWSDPTTLELFDLVVDNVERVSILLLVTTRPEFSPAWTKRPNVTMIPLDRLARQDAAALVGRVAGSRVLPLDVIEHVADRTDGVPLFVEELTKTVLESGLLRQEGERLVLDGSSPGLVVPETLQDSLLARLDRLSLAKGVAQIGAVIGREFSYRLLAAVSPLARDRLSAALRELVEAELIFADGEPPVATYTFKHALVQDAAYSTLLRSRRRQLHARIAAVLESDFPGRAEAQPELLAHHFTEAGHHQQAIDYWRKAGELSVRRAAMKEAAALLDKALNLLAALPEGSTRDERELDLLLDVGRTQQALKGSVSADCGRTYARARLLAEGLGRGEQLIHALLGQFYFHHGRTALDRAGESAAELLRASRQHGQITDVITAYDAVAGVAFSAGDFATARSLCEEALTVGARAGAGFVPLKGMWHAGLMFTQAQALAVMGHPAQAGDRCDEAVDEVRTLQHDYSLVVTLGNACTVDQVCRRLRLLHEHVEEMISVASERGFPTWLARGRIYRGWLLADSPRRSNEVVPMRAGLAELRKIGAKGDMSCYVCLLAEACGRTGQPREGLNALDEEISAMQPGGERWYEAELHRVRGELVLSSGDRSRGEACFVQALNIARRQRAKTWELRTAVCLARLWAEDGERKRAYALLTPVHDWFTEGLNGSDLQVARTLLDTLR